MEITNDNLLSTFRASGQTQEAFCRDNGIALERLRYYLYKKDRTTTKSRNTIRKNKKAPAFISFSRPECTPPKTVQDSTFNYTVIHGKFTHSQLVALIKELGC